MGGAVEPLSSPCDLTVLHHFVQQKSHISGLCADCTGNLGGAGRAACVSEEVKNANAFVRSPNVLRVSEQGPPARRLVERQRPIALRNVTTATIERAALAIAVKDERAVSSRRQAIAPRHQIERVVTLEPLVEVVSSDDGKPPPVGQVAQWSMVE